MAPRPFWKGYLKLSLVTCPVTMSPATTAAEKVSFHIRNAVTGNRVVSRMVDAVTAKPLRDGDEVKGYARGEDDYVLLTDEELDSVALESTRTIDIDMFVPADSIDWVWLDRPHYLLPADRVGQEAFAVIRAAMAATGTVGIARLVLYRRERAVMLEPRGTGIVVWTLRYGDEVRRAEDYFEADGAVDGAVKPDARALALVRRLIAERKQVWTPDMTTDPVQDRLLKIIAARTKKPRKPAAKRPAAQAQPDNVINIMDALHRSLAAEKKGGPSG